MLKSVTLTQHISVERWEHWIVAVPDDMTEERIQDLMRELWEYDDYATYKEERHIDEEPTVDITDAPPQATAEMMLSNHGLVYEDSMITAFTMDQLQAELERRRAKDSATAVA
jgi:hypothetical protein